MYIMYRQYPLSEQEQLEAKVKVKKIYPTWKFSCLTALPKPRTTFFPTVF